MLKTAKKFYVALRGIRNRFLFPSKSTLKSIKIYSEKFGFDRGTPIDRYYINTFLENLKLENSFNRSLEFGEIHYSDRFKVKEKYFLSHPAYETRAISSKQISFDLNSAHNYDGIKFDLILSTNVINFTKNPFVSIKHHMDMLNSGGTLVLTASASMPISKFDAERWGDYWRIAPDGLNQLLRTLNCEYDIHSFGSFVTSIAFLCGLSAEEVDPLDLNENDDRYPIIVVSIIKKIA